MIALLARTRLVRPSEHPTDWVYPPLSMTAAQVGFVALLLGLVPAATAADITGKIDRDIGSSGRKTYAVFVRMADRLLGGRGLTNDSARSTPGRSGASCGRRSSRRSEPKPTARGAGSRPGSPSWRSRGRSGTSTATGSSTASPATRRARPASVWPRLEEVAFVSLQRGPLRQLKHHRDPDQPAATPEKERFFRQTSSEGPCTWEGVKFYEDCPPSRPLAKPDVTGVFGGFPALGAAGEWRDLLEGERPDGVLVDVRGDNSFTGAQTAGVAALMLSANPELCPWEVKAIMEKTCRDLGRKGRDYTFGAGLLQARNAVRAAGAVAR